MSVFSDFLPDFFADAPPISQNKTVSKVNFSTHIFNYTDALHLDDFILFTFTKVFLDQRLQNTFSKKNAPCVLLLLMPACPFLNVCCLVRVCFLGFMHSSSSSSVSHSYLSPTFSNPPYRKMANFPKVSMQSQCSLV